MYPGAISHVCKSISEKLACVATEKSKCCIFKLHNHLGNVNGEAYEPHIMAIGPYHRDKHNIKMMEEHKLRYLRSLLEREKQNIQVYVSAIGEMEQEARQCYAEPIGLTAAEFTEMLVLDGCFIIELVRKFSSYPSRERQDDPIFQRGWMINTLVRDLMLFENQIPFFILCKLFDLISIPNNHGWLMQLLLKFFNSIVPGNGLRLSVDKRSNQIKHLLDLIHTSWRPPLDMLGVDDSTTHGKRTWRFINSATELREANVKFRKSQQDSLFDIKFERGYLLLPPLTIEDETDSIFRNLMAYEQYFGHEQSNYVSHYVTFLDSLINSSADVELLCDNGIIDNRRADVKMVSEMFNNLGQLVTSDAEEFMYSKMFGSVNAHCERRRNKWMAKLKRHQLNSPWAIMSKLLKFYCCFSP